MVFFGVFLLCFFLCFLLLFGCYTMVVLYPKWLMLSNPCLFCFVFSNYSLLHVPFSYRATSGESICMLTFLGQLIGHSLRCLNTLELEFAPIVWQQILNPEILPTNTERGLESAIRVLKSHDKMAAQCMQFILSEENANLSDEEFEAVYDSAFVTKPSGGGPEIELGVGGSNRRVTAANRVEYVRAVVECRLKESHQQIQALRKGIDEVFPVAVMRLLEWRDVERLVTGERGIDIYRWKAMTESNVGQKLTNWFWEIIEEFTEEEKQGFLMFAWGCKRLPSPGVLDDGFTMDKGGSKDGFPEAHTCYFTVDLPDYSSKEVMKKRFLYAIVNCLSIDNDNDDVDREEWANMAGDA